MGAQVVIIIIIILVVIIVMAAIGYNFWRRYFTEKTKENQSNQQTDKSSTPRSNITQASSTSSSDARISRMSKLKVFSYLEYFKLKKKQNTKEPRKEEPKKMCIQPNQLVKQVPKQTKDKVVISTSEKSKERAAQPIKTLINESNDCDEDDEDWEKERDNISSDARSLKTITKNNDQLYKEEVHEEDGLSNIGTIDFVSVHKNLPSFIPAPGQRYKGTRDSF